MATLSEKMEQSIQEFLALTSKEKYKVGIAQGLTPTQLHEVGVFPQDPLLEDMEPAIQEFIALTPEEKYEFGIAQGLTPLQLLEVGLSPAPIGTVEEQIEAMPEVPTTTGPTPTMVAPELGPIPQVTPAPTVGAPPVPTMPEVTPTPTIPTKEVTPAPEYAPTEKELAWAEMYGGTIEDIMRKRGEGIPKETQAQMIQRSTDTIMAREQESLRVMKNNMERKGITNSGFIFAGKQMIKAGTTIAIANSIRDVQIQSALMKMASFENALGHAGQFLGYLFEQGKMAFAGKMATWEAQNQFNLVQYKAQIDTDLAQWKMENQYDLVNWEANTNAQFAQWDRNSANMVEQWKLENQFSLAEWGAQGDWDMALFQIETEAMMANWSAQMDIFKLGITQAYAQGNMVLAAQIDTAAAIQQNTWNIELLEMELEAANQQAAAQGAGSLSGTIIEGMFTLAAL